MDSSQLHLHPTDYPHSSSMSEADSLSDSDWLDISSSKESDDNDSASSRASDHDEVDYGPPSRRSSISIGSSQDGDVEAWEGFTEDSADELAAPDDLIGLSMPPTLPARRNAAVSFDESLSVPRDVVIDPDVNAVLDQSMTGTLSASRSSSSGGHASTAQNSIRDLRLSFPDPLTSSQDELNITYKDVSPPETAREENISPSIITRAVDPGPNATPAVLNIVISKDRLPAVTADLQIVLYGVSAAARWSVVDSILEKAAVGAGLTLIPSAKSSHECIRCLQIDGHRDAITSFPKVVAVIDRTSDKFSHYPVGLHVSFSTNPFTITWRPEKHGRLQGVQASLAIVFLPSMSSISVTHTSYLPVLVPSDNPSASSIDDDKRRKAAESWAEGSIGENAFFSIKQEAGFVVDINEVANLQPSPVYNALKRLMIRAKDTERRSTESLKQAQAVRDCYTSQFFRTVVGGLLALGAILLVRFCLPSKQLATPILILPDLNKSSSPVTPSNVAVIPSSLKDFALAVFNPVPLSATALSAASLAKQGRSTGAKTDAKTKEPKGGDDKLMTWSERVKSSKELILPCSSLSFEARSKKALSLIVPQHTITQTEKPPSAISIRLADSLSQIFNVKALSVVVRRDMKELYDALDQLMIAIGKQTTTIMEESRGASKILREHLEQRHNKAKARARELRDMGGQLGGQLLTYVGGEFRSRADQAKEKAREMADILILSEAWTIHRKRVDEHRKWMEASSIERQKRREARRARRQARRVKINGKKGTGMFSKA